MNRLQHVYAHNHQKLLKLSVKNKGCSGSAYDFALVDAPGKFDEVIEQDGMWNFSPLICVNIIVSKGIKLVLDAKAILKVIGSEIDWVENEISAEFKIKNPNAKTVCGCGQSFFV